MYSPRGTTLFTHTVSSFPRRRSGVSRFCDDPRVLPVLRYLGLKRDRTRRKTGVHPFRVRTAGQGRSRVPSNLVSSLYVQLSVGRRSNVKPGQGLEDVNMDLRDAGGRGRGSGSLETLTLHCTALTWQISLDLTPSDGPASWKCP